MKKYLARTLICALLAGAGTAMLSTPVLAADPATDSTFQSLPAKHAMAIVQVKMVMKMPGGADEGQEVEVPGVMVDASGLVIVSNAQIGGLMARMGRPVPSPSDVRVLIGDDTEGLKAKVWTRASDIDLAWVKIDDEKAKGKTFQAIDLADSSSPVAGDRLYALDKMGKFFDRTISVSQGYVAATTKKPRNLIVPGGAVKAEFGLPIFTYDGKVAGIVVVQVPDEDEAESARGGGFEGPMILPASDVLAATKTAKEAPAPTEPEPAADAPAEGEKKDEAAPAGGESKPDAEKPAEKK